MAERNLAEFFMEHEGEYHTFGSVTGADRLSESPDLCAMLLLASFSTVGGCILTAAEHDQVWLGANPMTVNKLATDAQLITLIRCGVVYDEDEDGFYFFV